MKNRKIIRNIVFGIVAAGAASGFRYISKRQVDGIQRKYMRTKGYFDVTYQWVVNKQNQKTLDAFFVEEGIKTIAVYGMGSLGELFYNELKGRNIVEIKYFIDRMADLYSYGLDDIPVKEAVSMEAEDKTDAVVVTPVHVFDEIKSELLDQGYNGKILSLEDVISRMD